jgi:hypothetical protein
LEAVLQRGAAFARERCTHQDEEDLVRKAGIILLAVVTWSACADASGDADKEPDPNDPPPIVSSWAPLAADQTYEGKTLGEWAIEYGRWSYSQTSCDSPAFDQDGSLCGLYQDPESPVFFFDYSPTERMRTKCRVPAGKAIVVPILTFSYDNAGVDDPVGEDELRGATKVTLESMRDLKLKVDNRTVRDLAERAFGPIAWDYKLPPAPNWYSCNGTDDVGEMTVNPSFMSGYVAVFPPPDPGIHELQYGGVMTWADDDYAIDTRTRFIVEQARE